MNNDESIDRHLDRKPELVQARRASVMAHNVVIKLKEMGLPDDLDGQLSQICTDLGDLWSAQTTLARQVEAFLDAPDDWDSVGDSLADLRSTVDHMAWHMKGVRRPMGQITEWAYSQGDSSSSSSDEG